MARRAPSCQLGRIAVLGRLAPATQVPKISTSTGVPGAAARRHVGVGDRAADRVAEAAAGDATGGAGDAHRLGAQRDRAGIVQDQAREPGRGGRLFGLQQRVPSDELALVELDAEPQPGLVRVDVRADVRAPDAISLLEAQRIDRLVTAGDEAMAAARLPDRVPQALSELGRAVQLPAQLADVGDAQRRGMGPTRPRAPARSYKEMRRC